MHSKQQRFEPVVVVRCPTLRVEVAAAGVVVVERSRRTAAFPNKGTSRVLLDQIERISTLPSCYSELTSGFQEVKTARHESGSLQVTGTCGQAASKHGSFTLTCMVKRRCKIGRNLPSIFFLLLHISVSTYKDEI